MRILRFRSRGGWIAAAFATLCIVDARAATISIQSGQGGAAAAIVISGEIETDDAELLHIWIAKYRRAHPEMKGLDNILVDSPGGDVDAAMRIGEMLRAGGSAVISVAPYARCFSACVLILAGPKGRNLQGRIGIHRLFSESTEAMTYEQMKTKRLEIEKRVKRYLEEMNVSPSLFDAMDRIPAHEIKILTKEEYEGYGLIRQDAVEEERQFADLARDFGITREQANARVPLMERLCLKAPQSGDDDWRRACVEEVMHGRRTR